MTDFTIIITVPDIEATDILNTVTNNLGYVDGVTVENRAEFLRQKIRDKVKQIYISAKENEAHIAVITAGNNAKGIVFT